MCASVIRELESKANPDPGPARIRGVDTMFGVTGTPPNTLPVPRAHQVEQQGLQRIWNSIYIGIIPYCIVCKEPLDWFTLTQDTSLIFECPKCKRQWVKGEGFAPPITADSSPSTKSG